MKARSSDLAGGLYRVGCLVFAISLAGCSGGSQVDTLVRTGTITYNGAPLANVAVTFNPEGGGWAATGVTDAQGQFSSLTTHEPNDGIVAGDYTVTLSPMTDTTAVINDANAYAATAPGDLPFPTKYLNTAESDLKVTVSADGEEAFTFDLAD